MVACVFCTYILKAKPFKGANWDCPLQEVNGFTEHHKDELEVVLQFGNGAGWKGLTSSTGLGNQDSSLAQLLQEWCQEPVAESLTKNNRTTLLNAWSLKWRVVRQGDAFVVFIEVQAKKTSLLFPEMCNQCSLFLTACHNLLRPPHVAEVKLVLGPQVILTEPAGSLDLRAAFPGLQEVGEHRPAGGTMSEMGSPSSRQTHLAVSQWGPAGQGFRVTCRTGWVKVADWLFSLDMLRV
nr:uncharacterized protein LOC110359512 isoform X2 [Columba livia]